MRCGVGVVGPARTQQIRRGPKKRASISAVAVVNSQQCAIVPGQIFSADPIRSAPHCLLLLLRSPMLELLCQNMGEVRLLVRSGNDNPWCFPPLALMMIRFKRAFLPPFSCPTRRGERTQLITIAHFCNASVRSCSCLVDSRAAGVMEQQLLRRAASKCIRTTKRSARSRLWTLG